MLEQTLEYLASPAALESLERNLYWPKWHSPWWHMLLLWEMGEAARIPAAPVEALTRQLELSPLKEFPIDYLPEGIDPVLQTHCHCALGSAYQLLYACGVAVEERLPWIRPWFLRYQMEDGGFNCDNDAYLVKGECPSSMVGTIACFEAVLRCTPRPFTPEEERFLRKGADFLIGRKLREGSSSVHNAEERSQAERWPQPCFPRFYLYDVLRGYTALRDYGPVPDEIEDWVRRRYPGPIVLERTCYDGIGTRLPPDWQRGPATMFPLLEKVSAVGQQCPWLSLDSRGRT